MSLDYPNRADWLAKRNNVVAGKRVYGRMRRVMGESGKNRDPGLFHEHRRHKGPLVRATGPGSMNEEAEMLSLIESGHDREAAKYYEHCLNINYRKGKPTGPTRFAAWHALYRLEFPQ